MSRKKGIVFSAEQKTKIVLELLKEESTIAQLATKYSVTAKSIHNWKAQFLANASLAFEPAKVVSEYKEELKAKEDEIAHLQKALGKATIRADWAEGKKNTPQKAYALLGTPCTSLDYKTKKALIKSELGISIADQCEILGVSRSSLYYQPKPISKHNLLIMHTIDKIYTDNSDYGYRQIHQQLTQEYGFYIGKERVLKYMNIMGISAIYPKNKKLTSIKHYEHKIYPYLLKQYWTKHEDRTKSVYVSKANEVWSGDITYLRIRRSRLKTMIYIVFYTPFIYLAAVIDWHTKAILSYKISNSMDASLATDVLKEAIANYGTPKIFNSDQGSQYTSHEHTQIVRDNGIQISMTGFPENACIFGVYCGKGRSIDNIAIERFFRTLKHNNIYISNYESIKELKEGIKNYIYKYNFKRFHSSIGYKQPMNYYLESIKKAA